MKEKQKSNTVILTIILSATFLVAMVGATFAYFTAKISGNDTASSVIVNTASLGTITYTNGTELKLENAYPGATSNEVKFTIALDQDATTSVHYTLKWVNVTNDFDPSSDLVYSLKGTDRSTGSVENGEQPKLIDDITDKEVPTTSGTIIGSGIVSGASIHEYTLTVKFKETGIDQNSNQGKAFTGKIEVFTGDNGETYYNDANKSGTSEKPNAQ